MFRKTYFKDIKNGPKRGQAVFLPFKKVACSLFFTPGRIVVTGLLRSVYLSLAVVMMAAFLWPGGSARAEVRDTRDIVRVGIVQQMPQVRLTFEGSYRLVDASTGEVIAETSDGEQWDLENTGGATVLSRDGQEYGVFDGSIRAEETDGRQSILSGDGTILPKDSLSGLAVLSAGSDVHDLKDTEELRALDGKDNVQRLSSGGLNLFGLEKFGQLSRYRGNVEARPGDRGFTVINELPVEYYLYGVVPSEMPVSFPEEALKAQAVAARTYVINQLGSYGSQGFDVVDTEQSQVYRGYDGEHPQATRAIDETMGQVLVCGGQPIAAFFHASSGGYTENSEDVWKDSLEYIRGKEDPADMNDKHYNWTVTYSVDQLTSTVNEQLKTVSNQVYSGDFDYCGAFATITDLEETECTDSGQRVKKMLIEGYDTEGNLKQVEISNADQVRIVLGLDSALFTMEKDIDEDEELCEVVFTGSGWGHGLGMSQWGASGMAHEGYNYQDILQYYYTGVDLVNNYGL